MPKKFWMGFAVIWHIAVEVLLFILIGDFVADYFDSTAIGLIAAFIAVSTRLTMLIKVPIMFVTIGIPNLLFMQLGWIEEEDLQ
ncbi:hypothetical protein A3709_20460 [Halioglobus sp. HI00S01]|uniref:hypothetical protein n=1 Tax=Halioglobus sp. HI00S01 TaxID=1822214 RepID=UPI0007C26044|nr:hypothetical protein [Halioglobus sp. HI00S01]KZX57986.1 hypothetical protein A3709_20460 [Halioglobus sp. HI00S01]